MAFANLPRSAGGLGRNLVPLGLIGLFCGLGWVLLGTDLLDFSDTPAPSQSPLSQPPPLAEATPPPPPTPPPVVPSVLVAARDLPLGILIGAEFVEWRDWNQPVDISMAVTRDVVSERAVVGAVTRRGFKAGELLTWDGILMPGHPGFISAVLAPGMRAVTVEVDRATTAANLIYPGDRVDIILVIAATGGDAQATASRTIVRSSRVLAVGATVLTLGRYGRPSLTEAGQIEPVARPDGANYTLEVPPVDAERIAIATAVGQVTLAMRSINARYGGTQRIAPPIRFGELMPQPEETPAPPVVRILRGAEPATIAAEGDPA